MNDMIQVEVYIDQICEIESNVTEMILIEVSIEAEQVETNI